MTTKSYNDRETREFDHLSRAAWNSPILRSLESCIIVLAKHPVGSDLSTNFPRKGLSTSVIFALVGMGYTRVDYVIFSIICIMHLKYMVCFVFKHLFIYLSVYQKKVWVKNSRRILFKPGIWNTWNESIPISIWAQRQLFSRMGAPEPRDGENKCVLWNHCCKPSEKPWHLRVGETPTEVRASLISAAHSVKWVFPPS